MSPRYNVKSENNVNRNNRIVWQILLDDHRPASCVVTAFCCRRISGVKTETGIRRRRSSTTLVWTVFSTPVTIWATATNRRDRHIRIWRRKIEKWPIFLEWEESESGFISHVRYKNIISKSTSKTSTYNALRYIFNQMINSTLSHSHTLRSLCLRLNYEQPDKIYVRILSYV